MNHLIHQICFIFITEVTNVSPSIGSVNGGTILTISGHYFDESDAPAAVTISGMTKPNQT